MPLVTRMLCQTLHTDLGQPRPQDRHDKQDEWKYANSQSGFRLYGIGNQRDQRQEPASLDDQAPKRLCLMECS